MLDAEFLIENKQHKEQSLLNQNEAANQQSELLKVIYNKRLIRTAFQSGRQSPSFSQSAISGQNVDQMTSPTSMIESQIAQAPLENFLVNSNLFSKRKGRNPNRGGLQENLTCNATYSKRVTSQNLKGKTTMAITQPFLMSVDDELKRNRLQQRTSLGTASSQIRMVTNVSSVGNEDDKRSYNTGISKKTSIQKKSSHRFIKILQKDIPNIPVQKNIIPSDMVFQEHQIQLSKGKKVTPELAASVVRDYLLPMFENEGKIIVRKRDASFRPLSQISPTSAANKTTVFQELKLSSMLDQQLNQLQQKSIEQYEQIQSLNIQIHQLKKEIQHQNSKSVIQNKHLKYYKTQSHTLAKQFVNNTQLNACLQNQLNTIKQMYLIVEQELRKSSTRLTESQICGEKAKNQLIFSSQWLSLTKFENESLRDRLMLLSRSMSSVGDAKVVSDNFQNEILRLNQQIVNLKSELQESESINTEAFAQVNRYEKLITELQQSKLNAVAQIEQQKLEYKQKFELLTEECEKAKKSKRDSINILIKYQKELAMLQKQLDSANEKIKTLRSQKKIDRSKEICLNCHREFSSKENFNWSCCTHRSEWGGTMWWCCGKSKLQSQGCKFQKHITKVYLDEQDGEVKNTDIKPRCYICKQNGHIAVDCEKDPNLRTNYDVQDEQKRIEKIQYSDQKQLSQEASIVTQKLFEKLSMQGNERITKQILSQDDFNYKLFNQSVFDLGIVMVEQQSIQEEESDDGSCSDLSYKKVKMFSLKQQLEYKRSQSQEPFSNLVFDKPRMSVQERQAMNLWSIEAEIGKLIDQKIKKENVSKKTKKKRRYRKQNDEDLNSSFQSISTVRSARTNQRRFSRKENKLFPNLEIDLNLQDVVQNDQKKQIQTEYRTEQEVLLEHEYSPQYEVQNFQMLMPQKDSGSHFKFE